MRAASPCCGTPISKHAADVSVPLTPVCLAYRLTKIPAALTRLVFGGGEAYDGERLDDLGVAPGMGMQAISHAPQVRIFSADLSTHIDVETNDTVADVTSAILVRKPNAAGITLLWHAN